MNIVTVPHSIVALVFYALWVIALVLMVGADRVLQVMRGEAAITSFTPGVPHGEDSYWRINRAHINAAENLAVFAAIVLAGWIAGMESATFNVLAEIVVVARIVQSVIHISSGSGTAINFRFAAFGVQLVCEIWMAVLVLAAANVL
ncbi:MAG TPA: MAPEG family protein [Rhizomicrobium sp.]|nr:MAPEG family protein [Rhizomicrobium sp.]